MTASLITQTSSVNIYPGPPTIHGVPSHSGLQPTPPGSARSCRTLHLYGREITRTLKHMCCEVGHTGVGGGVFVIVY